jgi:hypothetical protein
VFRGGSFSLDFEAPTMRPAIVSVVDPGGALARVIGPYSAGQVRPAPCAGTRLHPA